MTQELNLEPLLLIKRELLERGVIPLWPDRYAEDTKEALFAFVTERCFTYNESSGEVELIPPHDYVRAACHVWWLSRSTGRPLIIEKSRRLIMSWVLRACELWAMGLRRESRVVAGLNYPKAADHVWRFYHLYSEMRKRFPSEIYPVADTEVRGGNVDAKQIQEFYLPNKSSVTALNQEGESFQGSGYSGAVMEEGSLYAKLDAMYAQAVIVCKGKPDAVPGQVVIITNSSPSEQWQSIKKDPSEEQDFVADEPEWVKGLPIGCEGRMTARGAMYLKIHYTADPGKRDPMFKIEGEREMGKRQWDSQMEMSEDVFDGEPVWGEYEDIVHCPISIREKGIPVIGRSMLFAGWDAGGTLNPAFVLAQLCTEPQMDSQLHILMEIIPDEPMAMERFAPIVLAHLRKKLPGRWDEVIHIGDPTITTRSGTTGETAQMVAKRMGIKIKPASTNALNPRLSAVSFFLLRMIGVTAPGFVIDPACKILRKALQGGYKYQDAAKSTGSGAGRILTMPLKNAYSHIADALQYLCLEARRHVAKPKKESANDVAQRPFSR